MKRIKQLAVLAVLILFSASYAASLHQYTVQEVWNILAGESDLHRLTRQETSNQILADGFYLPAETKLGLSIESNGRLLTFVRNKSGDSLHVGDVVIWDATPVIVVDTVKLDAGPDTLVIADSLKDEGEAMFIRWKHYDTAVNCSLEVYGITSTGDTVMDTLAMASGNGPVYFPHRFSHVLQTVSWNTAINDSLFMYAISYYGVNTTTAAASIEVAGVIAADCADNEQTAIVTFGPALTNVTCSSTEGFPGMYVETSTGAGKGQPNATETTSAGLGKIITPSFSDGQSWVFVNVE